MFLDIKLELYEEQDESLSFRVETGTPEVVVKLDPKYIPQVANWNENDPTSPGYIANRTHYVEGSGDSVDIGTEDLSGYQMNTNYTNEDVEYYSFTTNYDENLESPYDTDGNIEAKELYLALKNVYESNSGDVSVSIKLGDTVVSGQLLHARVEDSNIVDTYVDLFVIATDGGELDSSGEGSILGTTADLFQTNSAESKGVLLMVSEEIVYIAT